jgi:hypothetical protein
MTYLLVFDPQLMGINDPSKRLLTHQKRESIYTITPSSR